MLHHSSLLQGTSNQRTGALEGKYWRVTSFYHLCWSLLHLQELDVSSLFENQRETLAYKRICSSEGRPVALTHLIHGHLRLIKELGFWPSVAYGGCHSQVAHANLSVPWKYVVILAALSLVCWRNTSLYKHLWNTVCHKHRALYHSHTSLVPKPCPALQWKEPGSVLFSHEQHQDWWYRKGYWYMSTPWLRTARRAMVPSS